MIFQGKILHIHTSPAAGKPMIAQTSATCVADVGIEGDRYAMETGYYSKYPDIREVTLIEQETLDALSRDHDVTLLPVEHRRNLTVENVPLNHLVGRQFMVGEVLLEGGRLNTPCKYLDMLLDKSVCDRLRHRSGLNCRIIQSGTVRTGDIIKPA